MKYSLLAALLFFISNPTNVMAQKSAQEFYELRVYSYNGQDNENKLDKYFGEAFVPALHRAGIKTVGVFKTSPADTISQKKMYVLIPYRSPDMIEKLSAALAKDKSYLSAGADFLSAAYNESPFTRMEKIILKAFPTRPQLKKNTLTGDKQSRIYELRSYESPTESLFHNKVKMFNDGDEVGIFDRLGFNPIFYPEVVAGSHMPNLMYMTSFENKESREEHWKAFGADDQWNKLKSSSEYDKNNVSHIDIRFLYPAEYSDL
jgi:hypothetical protein